LLGHGDLMKLLEEMAALGPGHDWTEDMRRRYAGTSREHVHLALGNPTSSFGPAETPTDAYRFGPGQVELRYEVDPSDGTWKLAGCHYL